MRHHVIVGDGAVAAAFAARAALAPGDRLTLIGPGVAALGRGLAYAEAPGTLWADAYLLNSPAGAVDAAFPDWVAARWDAVAPRRLTHPRGAAFGAEAIAAGDLAALFLPRAVFGDYLHDRAQAALAAHAAAGVRVAMRATLVTDIAWAGGGFALTLAGGERVLADSVDVATGGPATRRFEADTGAGAFEQLYGHEAGIVERLTGAEVLCLGANAAMLDVLRLMQAVLPEAQVRLACLSPTGLLPEPLIWDRPRAAPVQPGLRGPYPDAAAFLAAVDADIAAHRAAGARMAELRRGYRAYLDAHPLADLLPDLAERRQVMPALERRFRRGTHDSLADFARLRAAGQIRVIRGAVAYVVARAGHPTRVRLTDGTDLTADLVINCAGPDPDAFEFMTAGLIARGWIERVPGGLAVGPGLETRVPGLRYLSPAVTEIGADVAALPLYDVDRLTRAIPAPEMPAERTADARHRL